jgi:transcriptional antiterminator RfaH
MHYVEGTNWYAIQTKSRQEDLVAYYLSSQLDLKILNPKQIKTRRTFGIARSVRVPLFPDYLFARFNPAKLLHTIQYTRGVRRVLHFGQSLLQVDDEIIERIRERLDPNDCIEFIDNEMVSGDSVTVREGAFSGMKGILKRDTNDQRRVVLLLDILGCSAEFVIDRRFLTPAV